MVSNNAENPCQLWNCINKILHRVPAPSLPSHVSIKSLRDSFSSHFKNKICLISSAFPDHTLNPVQVDSLQVNSLLASFKPATVDDEVRKIIMSSPNKSCDLDPLLTTLLKVCLDTLLYPITNIVHESLCSGLFPDGFKQAQVDPLLKMSTLSKENLNSYRPISNLNFISKVLEKVVASRLRSHIESNVSQSAYK